MKEKSIRVNAFLNIVKKCVNLFVPMITYPYISRALGAQAYGKYAFAESIMGYIALVSGFGVSTYAMREIAKVRDDRTKVKQLSSEIFTINIVTMLISLVLLKLLIAFVPRLFGIRDIFKIMVFGIVFSVLSRDWLNEAYEDYLYITVRYIFFQIVSIILVLMFVKEPNDVIRYAFFRCFALVGGYIVSIIYTRKYAPLCICIQHRITRHYKPLFIFFICSCASVIYIHSDITILGFFRTDIDVGIYSIVSKIFTLVKSFVNAIVLVMIPRAAYYIGKNKDKLYYELIRKLQIFLTVTSIPITIGIWCLSDELILVLAGEEYIAGNVALKILAIALPFAVFSYLYAYGCLIPNGMERYFLRASIMSAICNIITNIFLIPLYGMNAAAITTLLSEIIMYFIIKVYGGEKCPNIDKGRMYIVIASIIGGIGIYVESICIRKLFSSAIIRIVLLFIGGSASYFLILLFVFFLHKVYTMER